MRWLRLSVLVGTAVLSLALLGCGGNGEPPGIFGRVLSSGTRQPVANALVVVLRDATLVEQMETGTNGSFRFPNLAVGIYALVVTAAGFGESRVGVTLTTARPRVTVTVELLASQDGPPTDVPITD